jgi:hypothetical protein
MARPIRNVVAARSVGIVTESSLPKKLQKLGGASVEEIEAAADLDQAYKEMKAPL